MDDETAAFRFAFRVRYAEVDFQGIVYNAHYLTYFDVAIHEFCRELGYDYTALRASSGTDFHTVKALVEYRRPLRFDEVFVTALTVARVGSTSLTFALRILAEMDEEPRAAGEIVWVHADQASGKAVPLPSALLERLRVWAQPGA